MRIAVVMPRGSRMDLPSLNSMETVALTLNRWSRYAPDVRFICEEGAIAPADLERTLTIAAGLGKKAYEEAVLDVLKGLKPDLIEYHQQLGCAAQISRQMPDVPQVLYRHTRFKPAKNLIDRWRYTRRLKAFTKLVFVSQAARQEFAGDYPGLDDRAYVVCNPIDASAWKGNPDAKEPLIFFAGRAMADKGVDALCDALLVVLDRHPDWRAALMLGDWSMHASWAAPHVAKLDLFGGRVEVGRSVSPDKVRETLTRAAIAVVPSRIPEALGLSALEAHAAGATLISSGRGGLREASGEHAIFVDPPEAPALVQALETLITDQAMRLKLAREGQMFVASAHSPALRAAELDALRDQLLGQR